MSTLNVNTINAATSGQAVAVDVQNPRSNRNLIINGDMRIAQRATTSNDEDGYKHIDRWRVSCGSDGASITTSQDTASPADFVNSLKYTCTSAAGSTANSSTFDQFIEGKNIGHLNWGSSDAKAVTLSFWVKCSVANIVLGGCLRNSAFNMTYPFTYTTNGTADTWTKYTITIPGPTSGTWLTTNGMGIAVSFNLGSHSDRLATVNTWANSVARGPTGASSLTTVVNSTFYLTGVQLEAGSYATDFEHRLYADELFRCQRYYFEVTNGFISGARGGSGGSLALWNYPFPTPLRASPTIAGLTSFSIRAYSSAGFSDSTSTPAVATSGWTQDGCHIYVSQGSHSIVDDRVASILQQNHCSLDCEL